jgi:acyl dehydratase
VILYALGVGVTREGATSKEVLRFAYEKDLQVLPTMATVLASPGFWMRQPEYGIDWQRVLHAEQSTRLHNPIPVEGELISRLYVEEVFDKGPAKGAILYSRREIHCKTSGLHIATDRRATFLRGDGGRGGRTEGQPVARSLPERPCDVTLALRTRQDQALIYRLSGDYNPLHADPEVARSGGFERPILHGLCTYGVAGRALLTGLCDGDPSRLTRMDCRFSAPVYPGETIVTEIWREGAGTAAFRATALERGITVLDRGYAEHA